MKKLLLAVGLLSFSTANAIEYKCYASKYPTGMEHHFSDGYVMLTVNKKSVNLKYYYVNTVAKKPLLILMQNTSFSPKMKAKAQLLECTIALSLIEMHSPVIQLIRSFSMHHWLKIQILKKQVWSASLLSPATATVTTGIFAITWNSFFKLLSFKKNLHHIRGGGFAF